MRHHAHRAHPSTAAPSSTHCNDAAAHHHVFEAVRARLPLPRLRAHLARLHDAGSAAQLGKHVCLHGSALLLLHSPVDAGEHAAAKEQVGLCGV
jgi:hypothetical protein